MKTIQEVMSAYHPATSEASDFISNQMRSYSLYVAQERSIPSVADGLKPSQRISIWVSDKYENGRKVKTAGLAGHGSASGLYVHGGLDGTISRMASPILNNVPYFTGYGSFGTLSAPRSFSASRYTSVAMSDFSKSVMMKDSELHVMVPSIDGDNEICQTFLPTIPTVLLNGASGMAVGYSTDILPHSLKDIKRITKQKLNGKRVKNINPYWEAFDVDVKEIDDLVYQISGKIVRHNTTTVEIVSYPPNLNLEKLKTHLDKLEESGFITSYIDQVTSKISIVVKMRRADLANLTDDALLRKFKLVARMTERLVTVGFNGKIKIYKSHDELLDDWIDWRFGFYRVRYNRLLDIAENKLLFYQDVIRCFEANLPAKLPSIKSKSELRDFIKEICEGRDRSQIVEYATYKWTDEYYKKMIDTVEDTKKEIADYKTLLGSDEKLKDIFKHEIDLIKT